MTIHAEVAPHLNRQLARIRELGCSAGVAINPSTPLTAVEEVLCDLDLLLVMSVNPGFGGQAFIEASVDKLARARRLLDASRSGAVLQVDGGINRDTIARVWRAGADTFVAGHAVFSAAHPSAEIAALRSRCAHEA
jgi:ribulose-phosphate 3-epimerase